jgi:hypothetical protein
MKTFIGGIVLGFLMSCALAFATQNFDHNGVFWNKLNSSAKSGYVDGYSDAMQVSVGKLAILSNAADLFHWRGAHKIIHQLGRDLSMSGLRPAEAVKRLDRLYSNRKYAELDLGQALELVVIRAPMEEPADTGTHGEAGTHTK